MGRRKKEGIPRRRLVRIDETHLVAFDQLTPEQLSKLLNKALATSLRPKAGKRHSTRTKVIRPTRSEMEARCSQ